MSLVAIIIMLLLSIPVAIVISGFHLYYILALIPIIMFSLRKAGVIIKWSICVLVESLLLGISTILLLMMKHMSLKLFLVMVITFAIRILLYWYDNKTFIYTEEDYNEDNR